MVYPLSVTVKDTGFPFIVGSRGWRRAGWAETYYAADLPPEWRLAFYANEFTGVLVPAADWQGVPPGEWQAWHDDTPPTFRFLLECAPGTARRHASPAVGLGAKLAGWVTRDGVPHPGCLDAARLAEPASARAEVILCSAADLADRRALGRHLRSLASRPIPPVALIGLEDVEAAALRELRLLAELTGLA